MWRYLISLSVVTVVFTALVFVSWTPTAKAGMMTSSCTEFCEDAFICACALKLGGNLRETRCEFNTVPDDCEWGGDYGWGGYYCDCDPDPKCFSWKENDRVWLSFPQPPYNPCDS